jgi:hypothetical protein
MSMNRTADPASIYRARMLIWGSMLFAVGMYYVVTQMMPTPPANQDLPDNLLLGVSATVVLVSLFIRNRLSRRVRETGDRMLLRQSTVVGCALCEGAALLGVVVHFVSGSPNVWRYFLIGAVGLLLHLPRRDE